VIGIAILLTCAAPVRAQIYAVRDANGMLVMSDRPLGPDAQTFPVPRTTTVLTTRPVTTTFPLERFEGAIEQHAAANNLRPDLVRAVIQVESGFNPRARSPKGAMGLMQLMPYTANELGVVNPWDPDENIRGGTVYLRRLLDRFGGNEELALAAYNAGPMAVERYGYAIPPYRETRDYVRKVKGRTGLSAGSATGPRTTIYRTVQVVEGREVVRFTDIRPASGEYTLARGQALTRAAAQP
jgi:soluble lytic murein transglycosylase